MPAQDVVHLDELRLRLPGGGRANQGSGDVTNAAAKAVFIRLLAQGLAVDDCAKEMKRSVGSLRVWATQPYILQKVRELNEEAFAKLDVDLKIRASNTVKRITEASDVALDKILELMETAGSEQVQLKAAQDILDRNPDTSKTHKVQSTETKVTIDATFLQLAATAEKEITIDR